MSEHEQQLCPILLTVPQIRLLEELIEESMCNVHQWTHDVDWNERYLEMHKEVAGILMKARVQQ